MNRDVQNYCGLQVDPAATASMAPLRVMILGEIVRTVVITLVIARLIGLLAGGDWKSALRLAIVLWFGFSAMMWIGAIMWEKTSWKVAAIHSGDWLLKTTLIALILGLWRKGKENAMVSVKERTAEIE